LEIERQSNEDYIHSPKDNSPQDNMEIEEKEEIPKFQAININPEDYPGGIDLAVFFFLLISMLIF